MFDSFYNDCIKKNTIAFASLFNNIYVNREDDSDSKKIKVPLVYGGKEKYISRLQNPSSISEKDKLQITLPMLSFDMSNLQYDTQRHRNKLEFNKLFYQEDGETKAKIKIGEYPCLMQFNLTVYTRNIEENFQIIEQIAPYFTPEYILTMDFDKTLTRGIDVPINLVASKIGNDYEGGFGNRRTVVSTLQFVMRSYLFGPEREATPILTTDFNLNTQDSFLQFITDVQTDDTLYLNNQSITVTWRQGGIFPRNPTILLTNLTTYNQEITYDPEAFDVGDGTNSVTFSVPANAPLSQTLYVRVFFGTVTDTSPAIQILSSSQNISQLILADFNGTTFDMLMSSNHYFFTQRGLTQFARGNNLQYAFNYGSYNDTQIKTPQLLQYFYANGLTFRANTIANSQVPFGSLIHNGFLAGICYDKNRVFPCVTVYIRPGANVSLYSGGAIGDTLGTIANRRTSVDMFNATYGSDNYYIRGWWGWNGTTSNIIVGNGAGSTLLIEQGFSGYIFDRNNQARYPSTGIYSNGITNSETNPSFRTYFDPTFTQKLFPNGATGYRGLQVTAFTTNNPANILLFDSNIVRNSAFPEIYSGSGFNYLDNNDKMPIGPYMDAYTLVHGGNTYLLPAPFTPNLVTDMLGYTAYLPNGFTGRGEYENKFGSTYVGGWNRFFNFIEAGVNINGTTFYPPSPYLDYIFNDHELRNGLGLGADVFNIIRMLPMVNGLTTAWINRVKQDQFWPNLEAKYAQYPGLSFDRIFNTMRNGFMQFSSGPLTRKGPHNAIFFDAHALPLMEFYDEEVRKYWYGQQVVASNRSPGCKFLPVHVNRIPRDKDALRFSDTVISNLSYGVTLPNELIYHYPYGYPYQSNTWLDRYKRTGYGAIHTLPFGGTNAVSIGTSPTLEQINSASNNLLPWFDDFDLGTTGIAFRHGISYNTEVFASNELPEVGRGFHQAFFYEFSGSFASKGTNLIEKYEPFLAIKDENRQVRGIMEENYSHGTSNIVIYNNVLNNRANYFIPHGYENSWFLDNLTSSGFTYTDPAVFSKTNFTSSPRNNPNYQPINFYHAYNENMFVSKLLAKNQPLNILNQAIVFHGPYTNDSTSYFGTDIKTWNNFKFNDETTTNHILWDVEVASHGRTIEYISQYDDIDNSESLAILASGPFTADKLNPPLVGKARLLATGISDQNLILHRITLPSPYILTTDYGRPEQGSYYDDWYINNFAQNVYASSQDPITSAYYDNINNITTGNRDLDFYTKKKVTRTVNNHTWSTLENDPDIRRYSVDIYAGTVLIGNMTPSKYYPMGLWLITDEVSILPNGTTFNNYNLTFRYRNDGPITDGITTVPYRT